MLHYICIVWAIKWGWWWWSSKCENDVHMKKRNRLACGTVKNIVKVQVCNLQLSDNIEQIGHSDGNIEWSSDEDLDWLSGVKTAFELFRILFLKCFELHNYGCTCASRLSDASVHNRLCVVVVLPVGLSGGMANGQRLTDWLRCACAWRKHLQL